MTPRSYRLFIATYSYGGNGATRSEHPSVGRYLRNLYLKLAKDPRISEVVDEDCAETPISMARNYAVTRARAAKCDLILQIDSDMEIDVELNDDPTAKPFWESSFDFIDSMWDKYPVVVAAPYLGPPPHENVYVFRWTNCAGNNPDEVDMQLQAYSRVEAPMMAGIQEAGALPTGCCLYDMRLFDLIDPTKRYMELRNMGLTSAEAARAAPKWYDYEWTDAFGSGKGSTEDVYNTRDLSLAGIHVYGRNPVYCNWDAWAGHWKPKLVRKPQILTADSVSRSLVEVVRRGNESGVRIEHVDFRRPEPEFITTPRISRRPDVTQQAVTQATDQSPVSRPLSDPSSGEAVTARWQAWQESQKHGPVSTQNAQVY